MEEKTNDSAPLKRRDENAQAAAGIEMIRGTIDSMSRKMRRAVGPETMVQMMERLARKEKP